MTIIALVGMPGSGKSTVASLLEKKGFVRIRFGDIVDQELRQRGMKRSEAAEKIVRNELRDTHGMHAFALLNLPRIRKVQAQGKNIVIDGMKSLEEFEFLKEELRDFIVLAVHSSKAVRHQRLQHRSVRPLTKEQAEARDAEEIEKANCLGPIAQADATVINEGDAEQLRKHVDAILQSLE